VGSFEDRDAGIRPQARIELAMTHVDGDDRRGAALEETVGEPAGRGSRVERPLAGDLDVEPVEGGVKFLAAPTGETGRWALHHEWLSR
jgi:hypothetical protein